MSISQTGKPNFREGQSLAQGRIVAEPGFVPDLGPEPVPCYTACLLSILDSLTDHDRDQDCSSPPSPASVDGVLVGEARVLTNTAALARQVGAEPCSGRSPGVR